MRSRRSLKRAGLPRRVTRVVLLASVLWLVRPMLLRAQSDPELSVSTRSWQAEIETAGINAALGVVTTMLSHAFRHEPIWSGVAEGAAGGAVMYAGKRVTVEHFDGAGFLGREVGAVGASVVRNASDGRPALSRLILPLGLVRLYVEPRERSPVHARLDLAGAIVTAYSVADPDLHFDPGATLSAGAPVFVHDPRNVSASHIAGVVWLPDADFVDSPDAVFAHERVHALQYDEGFIAAAGPVERWLFPQVPHGEWLERYVDLGLNVPVWGMLNLLIDYRSRPWEREAYFLTRTRHEHDSGIVLLSGGD